MEFRDLVAGRRSTRQFTSQEIAPEALAALLETVSIAPSAGNLQACDVYLVADERQRALLSRAAHDQAFVIQAPVVLVFCASPSRSVPRYGHRGAELYALQDATIACTFAMLAATDLGLASTWVGAFDEVAVSTALDLPPDQRPVALLPVGHPAEWPDPRPRRSLSDLVHRVPGERP